MMGYLMSYAATGLRPAATCSGDNCAFINRRGCMPDYLPLLDNKYGIVNLGVYFYLLQGHASELHSVDKLGDH